MQKPTRDASRSAQAVPPSVVDLRRAPHLAGRSTVEEIGVNVKEKLHPRQRFLGAEEERIHTRTAEPTLCSLSDLCGLPGGIVDPSLLERSEIPPPCQPFAACYAAFDRWQMMSAKHAVLLACIAHTCGAPKQDREPFSTTMRPERLPRYKTKNKEAITLSSPLAIHDAAAAGAGVALLPQTLVRQDGKKVTGLPGWRAGESKEVGITHIFEQLPRRRLHVLMDISSPTSLRHRYRADVRGGGIAQPDIRLVLDGSGRADGAGGMRVDASPGPACVSPSLSSRISSWMASA